VVDIEQESLENEKVDGVSSINVMNRKEQGTRADGGRVSFQTVRKIRNTDTARNAIVPIMAGNLPKSRPNRAIA
jgi:hypothetical protein